jgi:hypothetical protein
LQVTCNAGLELQGRRHGIVMGIAYDVGRHGCCSSSVVGGWLFVDLIVIVLIFWRSERHRDTFARLARGLLLIRRTLLAAAYLGRVGGPVCVTRRRKGLQRRGAYVMRLTFSSRDSVATGWDEFNPPRLTAAEITHCTDGQSLTMIATLGELIVRENRHCY